MIPELSCAQYLTAGLVVTLVYLLVQTLRQKRYHLPPGPRGLPLVGNYWNLTSAEVQQTDLMTNWAKEYGDIFMFSVFGTRFVVLNSFALVSEAFRSADINDRAPIPPCNKALRRPNTGNGLVQRNEGPLWKEQRSFVMNILRNVKLANHNFEDLVAAETSKLVKEFAKHRGAIFSLVDNLYVTVANVTINILTGKTYEYDDEEFLHMTELARGLFDWMGTGSFFYHVPLLAHLPLEINKKGDRIVKEMFDFIIKVVGRHRQAFDPADKPKDFIGCFLKEQSERRAEGRDLGSFDDNCLLQTTMDLIFGGFETVSSSLSWYFLIMAQYPDVQAKVQAELDEVVGHDRLPSLSDRQRLPFSDATIAECYRLRPVIPVQIPHRTRCDVKLRGYDIPKGTYVATNANWLSSSPELWREPGEMRPERFLDERTGEFRANLESELAEFGVGRRVCPGEQLARTELFIIFTHVLHRFTLELPEGAPASLDGVSRLTFQPLPFTIRAIAR